MKTKPAGIRFGRLALCLALVGAIAGWGSNVSWAGDWTDKVTEDPGTAIYYKHPHHGSYTGPFDYQPDKGRLPIMRKPAGCNCFTFDGTKSVDASGEKLTYMWDFGDGQTSDQPVVNHCFDAAGDYRVTLTVKNESGAICGNGVAVTNVSPNFPPVPNAGADKMACLGEAITFDASATAIKGTPTYTWDFGDGETAQGVRVTHAYQKEGNYRVILNVDDGKKTECSVAATAINARVNAITRVMLKAPESSCTGRNVSFDTDASGGSLKYRWDFGDGTTAEGGSSMSHVYQKGGTYTISVTADNGQGSPCSVAADSKRIKINEPPIANIGENLACCVGVAAVFDGSKSSSPTGGPLTYRWDFGDGATSDQAKTTHAYDKPGNYRVVLMVNDNTGSECGTSSDSFIAKISGKPEAVIEVR